MIYQIHYTGVSLLIQSKLVDSCSHVALLHDKTLLIQLNFSPKKWRRVFSCISITWLHRPTGSKVIPPCSNLKWFNKRQIKIIKYSNLILYHRYCFYDIWIIILHVPLHVPLLVQRHCADLNKDNFWQGSIPNHLFCGLFFFSIISNWLLQAVTDS